MFHRRLLLVSSLFVMVLAAMSIQLGRLTLLMGPGLRAEAEAKLVRREWSPTTRGRILDRKGRELAKPIPSYDICIDYAVLSGAWVEERAGAFAKRAHAGVWSRLAAEQRAEFIARYRPAYEDVVQSMFSRLASESGTDLTRLLDERDAIIARVERMHEHIRGVRARKARDAELARGRELTEDRIEEIERQASLLIEPQKAPHAILVKAPDEVAFALNRLSAQTIELRPGRKWGIESLERVPLMPGVSIQARERRAYPLESIRVEVDRSTFPGPLRSEIPVTIDVRGVATHLLGWMRTNATRENIAARDQYLAENTLARAEAVADDGADRGRYMDGDEVGAEGLEALLENDLRGLRGLTITRLDTAERLELPPRPGHDVRLALDIMLQARVQAVMDPSLGLARVQDWHGEPTEWMPVGTDLHGAAVVLDIESGDVLAMVTTPSFTRDDLAANPRAIFQDELNTPWVDRTISKPYPPGSIAKAIILCGAVAHSRYSLAEPIECTGHLLPNNTEVFRCWIYKRTQNEAGGGLTHQATMGHPLSAAEALMASCNIFFYTLGGRLGPLEITQVYKDFGLGRRFGFKPEARDECEGQVGRVGDGSDLDWSDAVLMGIGQGPVAWTPLHAAQAYATLARFGVRKPPRLVRANDPPPADWINLDPATVRAALEGLRLSVSDPHGTGHHITFADGRPEAIFTPPPGVTVWGKTGTAQAPNIVIDPDGKEGALNPRVVRAGDHSWFVVMVGREKPQYVIAVMMEYAGSGGKVSGPIVNQIIRALAAEGYL